MPPSTPTVVPLDKTECNDDLSDSSSDDFLPLQEVEQPTPVHDNSSEEDEDAPGVPNVPPAASRPTRNRVLPPRLRDPNEWDMSR